MGLCCGSRARGGESHFGVTVISRCSCHDGDRGLSRAFGAALCKRGLDPDEMVFFHPS